MSTQTSDTPRTKQALADPDDWVVRESRGQGVHCSVMRAMEREANASAELLRRLAPLLESAAAGHAVSMAAGELLRDVNARLATWDGSMPDGVQQA